LKFCQRKQKRAHQASDHDRATAAFHLRLGFARIIRTSIISDRSGGRVLGDQGFTGCIPKDCSAYIGKLKAFLVEHKTTVQGTNKLVVNEYPRLVRCTFSDDPLYASISDPEMIKKTAIHNWPSPTRSRQGSRTKSVKPNGIRNRKRLER